MLPVALDNNDICCLSVLLALLFSGNVVSATQLELSVLCNPLSVFFPYDCMGPSILDEPSDERFISRLSVNRQFAHKSSFCPFFPPFLLPLIDSPIRIPIQNLQ